MITVDLSKFNTNAQTLMDGRDKYVVLLQSIYDASIDLNRIGNTYYFDETLIDAGEYIANHYPGQAKKILKLFKDYVWDVLWKQWIEQNYFTVPYKNIFEYDEESTYKRFKFDLMYILYESTNYSYKKSFMKDCLYDDDYFTNAHFLKTFINNNGELTSIGSMTLSMFNVIENEMEYLVNETNIKLNEVEKLITHYNYIKENQIQLFKEFIDEDHATDEYK